MTIITTQSRITYSGDNVTTVFPIPFEFFLNGDITAVKTAVGGGVATLIQNIDYTLAGANVPSGGSATKATPLLTGETLAFFLNPPITQGSHYLSNAPFPAATLENDVDRQAQISQRLQDQLSRSLRAPDADPASGTAGFLLPSSVARANTYLTFDANGNPAPAVTLPSGTLSQATIGQFLYPQSAAEATAGVTPSFYFYPPGNILRYGAIGDGATDNFIAYQKGVAVSKVSGRALIVPAGNYVISTTTGSLTLEYVTIQGDGALEGTATPGAAGSVLSITGTANSPFKMRRGVTLNAIGIYYPAQVDSAAPIVFPPTIAIDVSDGAVQFCYIQNCTVFNAYRFFVDTDAAGSIGHIYIDNNSIYGILTCFEIAYNAEIIHWTDNDFTFGLFVSATEAGLRGYTRANGTCLQMTRTDGFTFTGNLMFGYLNGINFPTSGNLCQLMNIIDNIWDNVRFGIVASGTGNLTGMSVSGNSFGCLNSQNTALLGTCILVSTSGAIAAETWDIGPNYFGSTTGDLIKVSGTPTRALNFSGGIYTSWAAFSATGLFAAFNISGGATAFNVSGAYVLSQSASTQAAGILGTCSVMNLSGVVFGQCVGAIGLVGTASGYNIACATGCTSYGTTGTLANNYFATTFSDVGNSWDKNSLKSPNVVPIAQYGNYANDAAAAAAGVPIGGQYRNASVVQVRVT